MKTYNRIVLVGRLGKDPEVKVLSPDSYIVELRLATNHWNSKTASEETTWHGIKVVGKRAERVAEWAKKGDLVLVEGELREDTWKDKATGEQRRKAYILAFDATTFSPREHTQPTQPAPHAAPAPSAAPAADDWETEMPF